MRLEWAWLDSHTRVAEPDNEVVLEGTARCRVLLLHGITGTPTEFAYTARYLNRRGRLSVECRRLVNHGQPLGVLASTRWTEILESARTHYHAALATARRNGEVLVLGGLSLGAVLSLILAAENPADVAGVMVLSPTLFYDGWNAPWTQRLIPLADHLPIKRFLYLREQPPYGLKDEGLRKMIAANYEGAKLGNDRNAADMGYAHFPLQLFCEMRHIIALCRRRLSRVTAPLLLLQAEEDEMTSPRNAHYIVEHVRSRRTELVMLANSYHVITADLDHAKVAASMTQFCLSLLQPPSEDGKEQLANA
jgi:carboxylesterase